MNELARIEPPRPRSVLIDMADRYGMEPAAFEATVRATCMAPDRNGVIPTREEFAAFLLVAREYKLNPLTKEIFAFAKKGGGIIPVVSVDGWMNLVNSHSAFDGMEFEEAHDANGNLVSTKCTIYRKDRSHPTSITEYLSETRRDTDPWKMKHRMNRHKAAIQCARYAFGFVGLYDEDEAERIAGSSTRSTPPVPPSRRPEPVAIEHQPAQIEIADELDDAAQAPVPAAASPTPPRPPSRAPSPVKAAPPVTKPFDPEATLDAFKAAIKAATNGDELADAWEIHVEQQKDSWFPPDFDQASKLYRDAELRLAP